MEGSGDLKVFSRGMLDSLLGRAAHSSRLRQHLNIHSDHDEPCQRLFNALCIDSYIRPHRHSLDPKAECLIAVRGAFALFTFDDLGSIRTIVRVGSESAGGGISAVGAEVAAGVWHTAVALVPGTVLFEVKSGPFDPAAAKELAAWAPGEGTPEAAAFLRWLRDQADR